MNQTLSAGSTPKFLVVDDSATIRKMIMSALRPLNASFREASSGLEAIEQLMLSPYDMVTLDLNMPDMHGLDFLQFVRGHKAFKDIPILVITTRADAQMREVVLSAGANRYMTKPFSPDAILDTVKDLLG